MVLKAYRSASGSLSLSHTPHTLPPSLPPLCMHVFVRVHSVINFHFESVFCGKLQFTFEGGVRFSMLRYLFQFLTHGFPSLAEREEILNFSPVKMRVNKTSEELYEN